MISLPVPKRGEIWLVGLDPVVGDEMGKTRPAVVVSSDAVGVLAAKLVVPLTRWQDGFTGKIWHVRLEADSLNNLDQVDSADALQIRCIAVERFIQRIGRLSASLMEEITTAIAAVVDYQGPDA